MSDPVSEYRDAVLAVLNAHLLRLGGAYNRKIASGSNDMPALRTAAHATNSVQLVADEIAALPLHDPKRAP